jgi:histidinol-phosphate aminotransferase
MTHEYERVTAPAAALRLHLNENSAGCSPAVIAALQGLSRHDVATYPDYDHVVAAAAARLGVAADRIVLTNGLDDGILAAAIGALRHSPREAPYEAIVVVPAFDMYAVCTDAAGGRIVEVPLGDGFVFPLEAILAALNDRTRAVFLTNPNNPTGGLIQAAEIVTIARRAPGALIFVDEAYADFAGQTLIGPGLDALPRNIVVGRTFAKAYGLAGMRAGALVGHPDTIAPLRRTVPPYTLNVGAVVALPAALADTEYFDWYVAQVDESRQLLYRTLDRLRVPYWPSHGNFVLVRFGADLRRVIDGLADRGIAIRDRSRDPGCAGCARITTGVVEHTARCARALEEVLCGAAS